MKLQHHVAALAVVRAALGDQHPVIVLIVPQGDPHGAAVLRCTGQALIPHSPGGGLERLPPHPPPGHIDTDLAKADIPSRGHPPHEGRIRIGLRASNAVIHMYGQDGPSVKRSEKPQERQGNI